MASFASSSASKLPGWVITIASIGVILLWSTVVFWAVIFIARGMLEYAGSSVLERFFAVLFTFLGVVLLLQVRSQVILLRKHGLRTMVRYFLEQRILELLSTTILMVGVAVVATLDIQTRVSNVLLFPLVAGTTFGFTLGQFMESMLHIPFAPFIILASSWVLQLFWMYVCSWIFVRVFLRFQHLQPFD